MSIHEKCSELAWFYGQHHRWKTFASTSKISPKHTIRPSSYDAVYSTMSFVKQEIKQKRIYCTSLTFDLPLFWKASEIKADKSPEFDCIHLKLGGFHQLMSFMGDGCKLMQDPGLRCGLLFIKKTLFQKCWKEKLTAVA